MASFLSCHPISNHDFQCSMEYAVMLSRGLEVFLGSASKTRIIEFLFYFDCLDFWSEGLFWKSYFDI